MATDNGGVIDAVSAELNPDPDAPTGLGPDAKGPDPGVWSEEDGKSVPYDVDYDTYSDEPTVERREVVASDDGVETVTVQAKGPDPAVWGDEVRAERGAETDIEG